MQLSIIIIAKNEEKCLPRLLKSICSQDFKDYEIILSDAQSVDKTIQIAKNYGCRVVKGGLPSKGRNAGARYAKGDFLLFLDSDVVLPPHFLRKNIQEMIRRKVDCATPWYTPLSSNPLDKCAFFFYNIWACSVQYFYPHAAGFCIFCTKAYWKKVKGFPENILMCEDHYFVSQVQKAGGKFRILFSIPLWTDIRRFSENGRVKVSLQYLKIEITRIFKGDNIRPNVHYILHGQKKGLRELYSDVKKE